jgi:hypothetical protein
MAGKTVIRGFLMPGKNAFTMLMSAFKVGVNCLQQRFYLGVRNC